MTDINYEINTTMIPAEAIKVIKRAAAIGPLTVMVHADISLPTSPEKAYPFFTGIEVTKKVALKMLADMQRFHDGKIERNEPAPTIRVCQHVGTSYKGNPPRIVWLG